MMTLQIATKLIFVAAFQNPYIKAGLFYDAGSGIFHNSYFIRKAFVEWCGTKDPLKQINST